MEYKLSKYQEAIIDAYRNTKDNLFISARAGTGKTFLLTEIAKYIDTYSVFLAFNKSIQLEILTKITNPKFKTYTFNGIGYLILLKNMEDKHPKVKVTLDNFKTQKIIQKTIDKYIKRKLSWDEKTDYVDEISAVWEMCKCTLTNIEDSEAMDHLIRVHGFFEHIDEPDNLSNWLQDIKTENYRMAIEEGIINFSDQLYITVNKLRDKEWTVPPYLMFYNILVDEAQDTNRCQQVLVFFLKRKDARCIFVGDKFQAIYAFSGADAHAYETIKTMHNCKEFLLPINYRCGKKHLTLVNKKWTEIGIEPAPDAIDGTVQNIHINRLFDKVQEGDFILSRKNSDLIAIALKLLKEGKAIYIKDKEIVNKTLKFVKRHSKKTDTIYELKSQIAFEQRKNKKKQELLEEQFQKGEISADVLESVNFNAGYLDILECVVALIDNYISEKNHGNKVDDFLDYIPKKLNTEDKNGCVVCTSIHQAKGLEADNVFVLNEAKEFFEFARTSEQRQQEKNLSYVALTRAKKNLYLVRGTLDDNDYDNNNFDDDDFDDDICLVSQEELKNADLFTDISGLSNAYTF